MASIVHSNMNHKGVLNLGMQAVPRFKVQWTEILLGCNTVWDSFFYYGLKLIIKLKGTTSVADLWLFWWIWITFQQEEEFESTRKNFQKALDAMQTAMEQEAKGKAEAIRMKKKLEADVVELEMCKCCHLILI